MLREVLVKLSVFDEYPFHQHPTPFNIPGTSDVHFNDGYFCAVIGPDWYVVSGIRLHPNMNVIDGFAGIARGSEQRVLRTSRALRPNAGELAVGPLAIEVVEPMRKVLIRLAKNDGPFHFELVLNALADPFLEAPYQFRKHGALIHDMVRYTQVCSASGTVTCDGETAAVNNWMAIRDHSWGVRSGMGPPTKHGGVARDEDEIDHRRFRIWCQLSVAGHSGFFNTHEDENGKPLDFEGRLDRADGSQLKLVACKHRLRYAQGTRNVTGGEFSLCDVAGNWHDYRIEAAGTPADVQGLGYYGGWHDGGSAGMYRGVGPVVETDRYPSAAHLGKTGLLTVPEHKRLGPTEFPCFVTAADGARGTAHFEHHVFGAYKPYNF